MKKIPASIIFAFLTCLYAFANNPESSIKKIIVSGTVVDQSSNQELEYATIAVYQKSGDAILGGGITDNNGRFQLEISSTDFIIKISYLGYADLIIEEFQIKGNNVDLSTLYLSPSHTSIKEVAVVAEKSHTIFKLDKRIFNVGKDILNSGGTALDVLNNVPSVDVSIQGVISLRGSTNVQVLINGKPSVMASSKSNAMGTITADMIDRVEVITNPSAKYDAEGTTGIINIIIKKEEKKGLNGSVTINTGIPNNHSVGISLNRRTEKFNLFNQLGAGKRTYISNMESITENKSVGSEQLLISSGEGEKNEEFYNIVLGTDYHINQYNTLTLSGHFAYEIEDETSDIDYDQTFENGTGYQSNRLEITEAINPKWEYDFQYKKEFKNNEDHNLLASARGSYFGKNQSSDYINSSGSEPGENYSQRSKNNFGEAEYTFQADYENPLNEWLILEAGAKYEIGNLNSDYKFEDLEGSGWVINPDYTNNFLYNNGILAAYTTFAYEKDKWGLKFGVRAESTNISTELKGNQDKNHAQYLDLFPSFHSSFKVSNKFSMQLGYSRRIQRPDMDDLNPFESLSDNKNVYTGNPDLNPEYTHSYELNLIQKYKKVSLNAAIFHRTTSNVISEITTVEGNTTYTKPYNIGTSENSGVDFNGKMEVLSFFNLSANAYWSYYNRQGKYQNQDFDFNSSFWAGRLTAKIKFPWEIDLETRFRYRSKYKSVQSTQKEYYYLDLGLKKKIMKGRAIINFSIQDVFNTRGYESQSTQPEYNYYQKYKRNTRYILGISFGFGKGEAMEFSGHKMF